MLPFYNLDIEKNELILNHTNLGYHNFLDQKHRTIAITSKLTLVQEDTLLLSYKHSSINNIPDKEKITVDKLENDLKERFVLDSVKLEDLKIISDSNSVSNLTGTMILNCTSSIPFILDPFELYCITHRKIGRTTIFKFCPTLDRFLLLSDKLVRDYSFIIKISKFYPHFMMFFIKDKNRPVNCKMINDLETLILKSDCKPTKEICQYIIAQISYE